MATYTSGPKVNAAVSATRSTNGTMYTAPSNGYAILNYYISTNNAGDITVASNVAANGVSGAPQKGTIYVGPSQVVAAANIAGTTGINLSGVEFVNAG
jgi:hypothetical protein